ncbi:hypothetical protein BRPE64_CCDS08080 [Caballeronia insecticola]|uniref:Uncharacterized protein n=1 Tax=Caballeronia insecticola TaxID=758793 RepID=R4X2R7_9BURK|nr:hypothetical protein BRPE64_CCDS08080 [Caballeronia insecticola]
MTRRAGARCSSHDSAANVCARASPPVMPTITLHSTPTTYRPTVSAFHATYCQWDCCVTISVSLTKETSAHNVRNDDFHLR